MLDASSVKIIDSSISIPVHILQQCLHTPYVLQGGGCTETQLSHFLLTKVTLSQIVKLVRRWDLSQIIYQDSVCFSVFRHQKIVQVTF